MEQAIPALQKAIYHHTHATTQTDTDLRDDLYRCLATALSEVSVIKSNKDFILKRAARDIEAILYHKEAFHVWSGIREVNLQDVAYFKKFRHTMSFQFQNLALLYRDSGNHYLRQKLYKLAYENLRLSQKTLQEGLDLARNIAKDNYLYGVFSEKFPEPDCIMVAIFFTELEKINESIESCIKQMPQFWKNKLTRVPDPKDEVEEEEEEVIVIPTRPTTPHVVQRNHSLSFFSKSGSSSSSSTSSSSSSSKPNTLTVPSLAYSPKST
jgi:hypothetical protein